MSKPVRNVLAITVMALAVGPVRAQSADVDRLLTLLSQPGVVNNQLNPRKAAENSREDEYWVRGSFSSLTKREQAEFDALGKSSSKDVADAMRRLKPAMEMIDKATAARKASKVLIRKLQKENGPTPDEWVGAASDFLNGFDQFELDDLVRRRMITQDDADEYQRLRGKANANFAQKFTKSFGDTLTINILTNQTTHRLVNRAEVAKNAVVAETLLPGLRARAGAEQKTPPVQMKMGLWSDGGDGLPWHTARINLRSTSPTELTRVTVLVEFQTTQGSRFATLYLPRLAPQGVASFDPVLLSMTFLNNAPKEYVLLEATRIQYAVLCDQFRAEGQTPTITKSKAEMVSDTRLLMAAPGQTYVSKGGQVLHPNPAAPKTPDKRPVTIIGGGPSRPAPYIPEFEPEGRYLLVFKKLTPTIRDFEVELEFVDRPNAAKEPMVFRGSFTLPEVKFDTTDKSLQVKLVSGKQEMQLELRDGESPTWHTGHGMGFGRSFAPMAIAAPGSPDAAVEERMLAAMRLALAGKHAEAKEIYEKISADHPMTNWDMAARRGANTLKQLKDAVAKNDPPPSFRPTSKEVGKDAKKEEPAPKKDEKAAAGETRVMVDDVEYVYQGMVRNGTELFVTLLATSKKGEHPAAHGVMTLIDDEGNTYKGLPAGGLGAPRVLREGVPIKLVWRFGPNLISKKGSAPSATITRYALLTVDASRGGLSAVEFRGIPPVVPPAKK